MFSYFSSSTVDGATDETKSNEGVTAVGTLVTEHSSISHDYIGESAKLYSEHRSLTPATCTSWKQAHDLYCLKRGTLKASLQQILRETCEENQEIPWELPGRNSSNVLLEAKEVANFIQTHSGNGGADAGFTTPKSSASSWFSTPLKLVSAVASIIRDPDDEIDEWVQEGDDAFIDDEDNYTGEPSSSTSASTALDLTAPIINLDMTISAVQCLQNEIIHLPPDAPLVMGLSEWNTWARSSFSKHNNTSKMSFSVHDNNLLLQVLADLNVAKIVHREPKGLDAVVLSSKSTTSDNDELLSEASRIAISLWDIERAEEMIEQKLQEWSEQACECTKKALMYKKRNQIKIAMTQLAKRKLIEKRIDSDSRLQLQLLQTKNAIESAQSNRSMVDLMTDSTKLLRQLRENTPLEEIDETLDDLQSELDGLQEIDDTLSSLGNNMGTEEQLLEELQNLSISDKSPVPSTAAISVSIKPEEPRKISGITTMAVPEDSVSFAKKEPVLA